MVKQYNSQFNRYKAILYTFEIEASCRWLDLDTFTNFHPNNPLTKRPAFHFNNDKDKVIGHLHQNAKAYNNYVISALLESTETIRFI